MPVLSRRMVVAALLPSARYWLFGQVVLGLCRAMTCAVLRVRTVLPGDAATPLSTNAERKPQSFRTGILASRPFPYAPTRCLRRVQDHPMQCLAITTVAAISLAVGELFIPYYVASPLPSYAYAIQCAVLQAYGAMRCAVLG
eukprot:3251187-Rhodomonas_salina.3